MEKIFNRYRDSYLRCNFFVTITSPDDGSNFSSGNPIFFKGNVITNVDESEPIDYSLKWESNLDGPIGNEQIGTVSFFEDSNLSIGTHLITLTATDKQEENDTASVTINISDDNGDNNSDGNGDDNSGNDDNTSSSELPTSLTLSCGFCDGAFQDRPAIIATLDLPTPSEGLSLKSTCTAVTGNPFPGPSPELSFVLINFYYDDTVGCSPFALPNTCSIPGTCSATYTITDAQSAPWEPFESWAQQFIDQSVTCSF
jgi:hypothetical protein